MERVTNEWVQEVIEQHKINPMAWADMDKVIAALTELTLWRYFATMDEDDVAEGMKKL